MQVGRGRAGLRNALSKSAVQSAQPAQPSAMVELDMRKLATKSRTTGGSSLTTHSWIGWSTAVKSHLRQPESLSNAVSVTHC